MQAVTVLGGTMPETVEKSIEKPGGLGNAIGEAKFGGD